MRIGVIADDFTGATDIASFLVVNGLSAIQYSGTPKKTINTAASTDAIVISLKSRSCLVNEAISDSLEALEWLKAQGCSKFYFKYCSTFDSTSQGNIGPVTDALLEALNCKHTIVCPALPVNGRCVINGHLFVNHQRLNESGMKDHPVTPMLESKVELLMNNQSKGLATSVFYNDVEKGSEHLKKTMDTLFDKGSNYIVVDAFTDQHLNIIAQASFELPLVTGGSGLAAGIAQSFKNKSLRKTQLKSITPLAAPSVVISGSCSQMTNAQVNMYLNLAPHFQVDVGECINNSAYDDEICQWVLNHQNTDLAPLVYATAPKEQLKITQNKYGEEKSSAAVEALFAKVCKKLQFAGVKNFVVAGGETSGSVTKALDVEALEIGAQIVPGVPWVKALNTSIFLALKSGNFGDIDFFIKAQQLITHKNTQ
ncbi:3-oxo-tetronate kinase [Pseudoalteromonas sp. C12FD-1]|uniref:3-oxo-tetronate kinase n=1 Tax=Pseudoalteromonas sp. C12FD-1 TaxID=3131979 RepID=UPI00307FBDEF